MVDLAQLSFLTHSLARLVFGDIPTSPLNVQLIEQCNTVLFRYSWVGIVEDGDVEPVLLIRRRVMGESRRTEKDEM